MINSFKGDHAFLSNFYPSPVEFEGDTYPSVEHAYQAAKTPEDNWVVRVSIREASTAAIAKKLGKSVNLRGDWESIKLQIMRQLLMAKFSDSTLAERLLQTGAEELIEGNWWGDTFWGVCRGKGENHLGKLLMEIRDDIRLRQ